MTVDLISVAVIAVLVFLGWRSGALRQIVRILALIAVVVGVPFVAPVVRDLILGQSGRAAPGIEVASIVIAGLLIYVTIAVGGWFLIKTMRFVSRTLSFFDRVVGASVGGLKAVVLVYLFAALIVFLEGPLSERDPDDRLALRDGIITGFVGDYNVLAPWQFPDLDHLQYALAVAGQLEEADEEAFSAQYRDASRFLADERVIEVLDDPELMGWIEQGAYPLTLADTRIRALLNDREMMDLLHRVDWEELDEEVS